MKIVIDARFWGPRHTGIGVYTQHLVENLAKLDKSNRYVLLVRSEVVEDINLPENFTLKSVNIPAYSLAEQLILPFIISALRPDVVHYTSINVPVFYFGKYVVTIHDLIKHNFTGPETTTRSPFVYWLKQLGYLATFFLITKLSKTIIVPSETVKKELGNKLPWILKKTYVTYEAATLVLQGNALSKQGVALNKLPAKFCVYTGNAYPHKNLPRLIVAWKEIYAKTKCHLVLVCGRSVFVKRIEKLVEENKAAQYVSFLSYLSNLELVALYKKAQAFVFPTLAEGFGLPGLDAMALGLPVVCSDIPVLREIYEDAAIYFGPEDKVDIQQKIIMVIDNKRLRGRMIIKGLRKAKQYSWRQTVKMTQNLYGQTQ